MGALGNERMEADRKAGQKLMDSIWRERNRFVRRTGQRPTHLTMCKTDIWKLWIAQGSSLGSFRQTGEFMGMSINLVDELPEGMVVVS